MSEILNVSSHGYEIIRELERHPEAGEIAYLGRFIDSNQQVIIQAFQFALPDLRQPYFNTVQQQIEVLQSREFTHIPRYLEVFEISSGFCLVWEYLDLPSLEQRERLSAQEVKAIALSVLQSLVNLQKNDPLIVHQNISPSNILIDEKLNAHLVNFGFIPMMATAPTAFKPPEMLYDRPLSAASDLYSLGGTLISLLSKNPTEAKQNLLNENYSINVREHCDRFNPEFIDWLENMVAIDPKQRYPNAAIALQRLQHIPISEPAMRKIKNRLTTGWMLALLGSFIISFQNIITRAMLSPYVSLWGLFEGQVLSPGLGNALLLLAMRMAFVVPATAIIGMTIYPGMRGEILSFRNRNKWGWLGAAIASGFCLFLSHFTIYIALGNLAAGIVMVTFFAYPILVLLLNGLAFRDRPSGMGAIASIIGLVGMFLLVQPMIGPLGFGNPLLGTIAAAISAVAFALYLILAQFSTRRMHPVSFSLVAFFTILVGSTLSILVFSYKINPEMWPTVWMGAIVLGITTLVAYLFTHYAIALIGAFYTGLITTFGPALTSILAWIMFQEVLGLGEIFGSAVLFAVAAVPLLERERQQGRARR